MIINNVKDRTELLSRVGDFESESVRQEDIDLTLYLGSKYSVSR